MYICPMHQDIRLADAGKCPVCGMSLVSEDTRFPMVRHLAGHPVMLAAMFAGMFALMAAAMMLMR